MAGHDGAKSGIVAAQVQPTASISYNLFALTDATQHVSAGHKAEAARVASWDASVLRTEMTG